MRTMSVPVLPLWTGLRIDTIVTTETVISITAAVLCPTAPCPDCAHSAQQVHSTYVRHLHDLPWSGLPVHLGVRVRRFFCRAPTCARRTFVEQVDGVTRPHAQRTSGLNAALRVIGLALGGAAGARLATRLGYVGSTSTILRRVRQEKMPPPSPPRAVGVDDWAVRKGQRYGTVFVDLERHTVLDLLPEHTAEQITAWLQQYPTIEVVARDRATIYTEAIAQGAPQAQQVADRWHLVQNATTVLQEVVARHALTLRTVAQQLTAQQAPPGPPAALPAPPLPEEPPPTPLEGRAAVRQQVFTEAKQLHAAGWSIHRIARALQINRRTARRYVVAPELPRRELPQNTSRLTPYLGFMAERWAAGVQQGPPLLAELQARGYQGSLSSVYRVLKRWRTDTGPAHRPEPAVSPVPVRSPRQAAWLLLRAPTGLVPEDAAYRAALCAQSPTLARAAELAQRFLHLVQQRHAAGLEAWLVAAEASRITELVNFARSLRRDEAAVRAAD